MTTHREVKRRQQKCSAPIDNLGALSASNFLAAQALLIIHPGQPRMHKNQDHKNIISFVVIVQKKMSMHSNIYKINFEPNLGRHV